MSNVDIVRHTLEEAQAALTKVLATPETLAAIAKAGDVLVECFKNDGHVYSCGNGGSMCDAMHFAEELSGRFRGDRPALGAASISDASHISCVGNDYGYEAIFSRYLEGHARAGDCLLAISTSGKSKNVMAAAEFAKKKGVKVIGLMGKADSPLGAISDVVIAAPVGTYADRVQEIHIKVIHILIELVERSLFPANYQDK